MRMSHEQELCSAPRTATNNGDAERHASTPRIHSGGGTRDDRTRAVQNRPTKEKHEHVATPTGTKLSRASPRQAVGSELSAHALRGAHQLAKCFASRGAEDSASIGEELSSFLAPKPMPERRNVLPAVCLGACINYFNGHRWAHVVALAHGACVLANFHVAGPLLLL